jgi:hypothetical protein
LLVRPGGGSTEFAVALPERDYELAGHLMADAITDSTRTGTPIRDAVNQAAASQGAAHRRCHCR